MLAVLMAAENGDKEHRGTGKLVPAASSPRNRSSTSVNMGSASQSGTSRTSESPGDDGIDGDRAVQPVGGVEGEMFDPASRLEHPKEILDAPVLQVISDDLDRGFETVHIDTRQQEPLDRLLAVRRGCLAHMDQLAVVDLGSREALAA